MIDPLKWKLHPEPVFTTPNGALEDFAVFPAGPTAREGYVAYYTAGPNLQDQRLFRAYSKSPLGPFTNQESLAHFTGETHTRVYRGRIDANRRLVSAVWPGLPKCGIWLFTDYGPIIAKTLLVPPVPGTAFQVVAANPCIIHDGKEYNIFFEGRDERVFWHLCQATWDGDAPKSVVVLPSPVCEGANPSINKFKVDGVETWHLYFSRWNGPKGGFDTCLMTQPVTP